ncbi:MAG: HAMP domain-containing histidine kinase [Lachnospiraceae bacterium]|nr:HAMP domain-containing histidine kinase [Lachnospiraceae bacterium]
MIYRIKELWYAYLKKQSQKPIQFLIARYVIIWVLLCLVLTNEKGEAYFQEEAEYFRLYNTVYIQDSLKDLREMERKGVFDEGDNALLRYTRLDMAAEIASKFHTKTKTSSDMYPQSDDLEDYAYLRIAGNEEEGIPNEYYYCPIEKLAKVKEVTLDLKKNPTSAWGSAYRRTFFHRVSAENTSHPGWNISMIDGYLKKDTMDFRPGKVLVKYMEDGDVKEEFIVDCDSGIYKDSAYIYVTDLEKNEILFPEDTDTWECVPQQELMYMDEPIMGKNWLSPIFTISTMFYDNQFGSSATLVEKGYVFCNEVYRVPFSFLSGNLAFEYNEYLIDSTGEGRYIRFVAYAPGGFKTYIPEFFVYMLKYYILLALIMAFLAWLRYNQLYSLRARTGFHKSLINSMAHDLKTPLMVMQGFGENLKENVHTEKREYYAEQILENVAYLNGLVNKNLDIAKKRESEVLDIQPMYLMDLVAEAKERYQEKLDDKKLTLNLRGECFLHGDPKLLRVVIDNLISNAIKYAPQGTAINVYAAHGRFQISNKAVIHYKKNINSLLEPLEMADESRTSGMGTGLGLSIANGIIAEHGWRMSLAYNKKFQIFTVKVRPHR